MFSVKNFCLHSSCPQESGREYSHTQLFAFIISEDLDVMNQGVFPPRVQVSGYKPGSNQERAGKIKMKDRKLLIIINIINY